MTDTQQFQADTDWLAPMTVGEYETKYPVPEVGTYIFQLVEKGPNELKSPEYNKTGDQMQARFFFKILDDPDYADQTIMQFFSITFGPKAKIRPFIEAGIGRKLKPTDKIGWRANPNDPDSVGLEGLLFRATLTHNDNGYAVLSSPLPLKEKDRQQYAVPF